MSDRICLDCGTECSPQYYVRNRCKSCYDKWYKQQIRDGHMIRRTRCRNCYDGMSVGVVYFVQLNGEGNHTVRDMLLCQPCLDEWLAYEPDLDWLPITQAETIQMPNGRKVYV